MRKRWEARYGSRDPEDLEELSEEQDPSSFELHGSDDWGNSFDVASAGFASGVENNTAGEPWADAETVDLFGSPDLQDGDEAPQTPSWVGMHAGSQAPACEEEQQLVVQSEAKRARYTIVDGSKDSANAGDVMVAVGCVVPDVIEKEAVRLTDAKQFKLFWEKGRLAKFFGQSESAMPSLPKLQPEQLCQA